ncbi:MAG: ABC transporter ATP-binding protein [Dehalococcoidia bacterium]
MSVAVLSCRGVIKRFGTTAAVDGVDLDVTQGHILALLGPSGCGKTTLLRLIAGFEVPNAGEVALAGRLLSGPSTFVLPEKRRVAMVFQDFALFPHMNVASNVAFGLRRGADKRRRVTELLALVGLDGLESRLPHQLSGGQQQRVALARALASEPVLILLDEPFSNLDPSIRARVRDEVKQLIHAVGITAVFVTHDQEEALSVADQVAVMMDGRVLQVGAPAEVYTRPVSRVVGEFVGNANVLSGEVRNGVVDCELGRFPVTVDFEGPADVLIRAESLVISEGKGVPAEVVDNDYFGHDQLAVIRLCSGTLLRIRLPAASQCPIGQRVAVAVQGEVLAFPAGS